ncbi:MAG TPA: hypothetical protein VFT10_00085 [Solirubrobacterales bacterium]|nr:hypothetical protein [Solirubrobacterales bacterium]
MYDHLSEDADPFGQDRPIEFLYLDGARVEAYLAQMDGGTFARQRLSQKLTEAASGEITVPNAGKAGASFSEENFFEREVTATAASRFVELLHDLEGLDDEDAMRTIGLRHFREARCDLAEGDFVLFRTRALRPPTYLNSYLAVSQAGTLSALFPMPSKDPLRRAVVRKRREASRQFHKQVGLNPRVVFAIQPLVDSELGEVKYLLPMNVAQMTDERSLIKYGGGTFTVVGKVVRLYSEVPDCPNGERRIQSVQPRNSDFAYIDSPTRETWEHPLEGAPNELVCRTNHTCAKAIRREGGIRGEPRQERIEDAREEILTEMREQTRIEDSGAVIIPVAIYK